MLLLIFCLFLYSLVHSGSFCTVTVKVHYFSVLILLSSFLYVFFLFTGNVAYSFVVDFIREDHNTLVELFLLFTSLIVIIYTHSYNKCIGILSFEYYTIMLFCICSFCFFIHCNNIVLLYVLIELQSMCCYILTGINRNNRFSLEAGLKYFIIGSFSSILILFGFSFVYGLSGLTTFDDLSLFLRYLYSFTDDFSLHATLFAFIFFNIGFLFKIYASPFHFWVADIYQGSPTSVTMFLSTVPVICYIYVYIKLYICIFSDLFFFYNNIL